jgi:hypothetical protein
MAITPVLSMVNEVAVPTVTAPALILIPVPPTGVTLVTTRFD